MLRAEHENNDIGRLRFVFDNEVVTFGLAPHATASDVAFALYGLRPMSRGALVSIDVILADQNQSAPGRFRGGGIDGGIGAQFR